MPRKLPKFLDDDEAAAFLGAFNMRYPSGVKNRCMCRLMLDCGLRVGEVVGLELVDVNLNACRIDVRQGKGAKDRTVWMPESLRDDLGAWLELRPESPWYFPTSNGNQTSTRSVRRTVSTYAARAGIDWNVSPHNLRHTFATRLLRENGNLRIVQRALGHANIATTEIYTHVVDEEVEAAMRGLS